MRLGRLSVSSARQLAQRPDSGHLASPQPWCLVPCFIALLHHNHGPPLRSPAVLMLARRLPAPPRAVASGGRAGGAGAVRVPIPISARRTRIILPCHRRRLPANILRTRTAQMLIHQRPLRLDLEPRVQELLQLKNRDLQELHLVLPPLLPHAERKVVANRSRNLRRPRRKAQSCVRTTLQRH